MELEIVLYLLMPFFIIYGVYSLTLTILSLFSLKKQENNFNPKVTIIIPCRNEEDIIENTLKSVHNQDYDDFEVIIIDDNSSDKTTKMVNQFIRNNKLKNYKLLKRSEENSKKAKAVNYGLKYAKGEIIVFFDADNRPEKNCISSLIRRFSDDNIGAVQGKVTTNITNFISRIVFIERYSGFDVRFVGKERLNLNCQFSGTVVAIRKQIIDDLGGFDEESLTEDSDLTSKLIKNGYKIVYEPNAIASEESPPDINNYISQHTRWAIGHINCFFKHSLDIIKAPLSFKDKVDCLLFLFYYCVPILCGIAMLIGIMNLYFNINFLSEYLSRSVILSTFSFTPYIEMLVGVLKSKQKTNLFLIPCMMFFFALNIVICVKALAKNLKGDNNWIKTERRSTKQRFDLSTKGMIAASLIIFVLITGPFLLLLLTVSTSYYSDIIPTTIPNPTNYQDAFITADSVKDYNTSIFQEFEQRKYREFQSKRNHNTSMFLLNNISELEPLPQHFFLNRTYAVGVRL